MFYQMPAPHTAIVRTGFGGRRVAVGRGIFVVPLLQQATVVDLRVKSIPVELVGDHAVVTSDNVRCHVKAVFMIRVNDEHESIIGIATALGADVTWDEVKLGELFFAKFSDMTYRSVSKLTFDTIEKDHGKLVETLILDLEEDFSGYIFEDIPIEYFVPC